MREQIINTPSSADTELYNSPESVASDESQYFEPEDYVPSVATDNDEAKGSIGDGEEHDSLPKQLAKLEGMSTLPESRKQKNTFYVATRSSSSLISNELLQTTVFRKLFISIQPLC